MPVGVAINSKDGGTNAVKRVALKGDGWCVVQLKYPREGEVVGISCAEEWARSKVHAHSRREFGVFRFLDVPRKGWKLSHVGGAPIHRHKDAIEAVYL